ncbi:unnamed protein product [Rhizophagus irregularis]|nr:unnamed protein product [Rhizophagus irregularis]
MTVENISIHGRTGFLSHDSFKIQKATCKFAYPVAYYGINTLTAHEINKILFQLAANLECLGIHTCGSICDGAGENRNHIKSFDWWASFWCLGDIVEVNIGKNNYEKAKIMAMNLDHSKFTVHLLDPFFPDEFQVNRNLLRQPMPNKSDWKINDSCEFKNPEDNKWHLAIITNIDKSQTFFVTILSTKKEWKVAITSLNLYIRLPYNSQIHWMNHKMINPITGTPWYFISDPTHVFKKLRNNLSKSHIGEGKGRNIREIMIDGKEVSWRHVQGVYDYSCRNKTAKISRLTKRHIWLTSWSKMRVDLAEQTLSKDVENAMEMIDELKEISAGTREFINYSYLYRQIFHSKKPLENLADSRLQTLKEIRDWFVIRDNQKTSTMNWISPQCQFDLLLSIQGFLDMVKDIFTLYPDVTIEPRRVSQDMLEGLFGTIRQLGGDSSTQTLKGYGYALNKFQITSLVTAEMKSVNYGTSNHTEMDLDYLSRYDYRKKSTKNNDIHSNLLDHAKHLSNMSSFIQRIFKGLLMDDLFMGKIEIPTSSFNTEINQQNQRILLFQVERQQLFNLLIYNNEIISLLERWKNDIKNIILKSMPKRKGNLWTTTWISHLETCLNNYLCSGIWFQQVLEETIRGDHCENKSIQEQADPTLIPKTIITLNRVEASKFSYIVDLSALKKLSMCLETKSQTTIIIPGSEFVQFMYRLESLVIELFEKHNELGPNILRYVENSLLTNLHLNQTFIQILKSSNGENNSELENEDCKFIYERCVLIYMKSRQKTWRSVNNYIPEKGTASLRESLKKVNLPTNPTHALEQLRIWAQLEGAEESFAKMFTVLELLWLVRAFGVSTAYKRKQKLVPIVISNLKNKTLFIEEALEKKCYFYGVKRLLFYKFVVSKQMM